MARALADICNEPLCIQWGLEELFAPAYVFAMANGRGVGWVAGAAAQGSPSKECHVDEGEVSINDNGEGFKIGDTFFSTRNDDTVQVAGHQAVIDNVQQQIEALGYTREKAFAYLQSWFPDYEFIP